MRIELVRYGFTEALQGFAGILEQHYGLLVSVFFHIHVVRV